MRPPERMTDPSPAEIRVRDEAADGWCREGPAGGIRTAETTPCALEDAAKLSAIRTRFTHLTPQTANAAPRWIGCQMSERTPPLSTRGADAATPARNLVESIAAASAFGNAPPS